MNVHPIKQYRAPTYPTRLAVLSDSALLENHLPPAWRKTAQMASLAAFFLAVNGCVNNQTTRDIKPALPANPKEPVAAQISESNLPETLPVIYHPKSGKAAVVAPIFEHGEGRGWVGCMMVAPPVFLSEDEALQIIADELSDVGINVSQKNLAINNVFLPRPYGNQDRGNPKPFPFSADLIDTTKEIAIEYVSEGDCFDLEKNTGGPIGTNYQFIDVARFMDEKVKTNSKGLYFAAFYDPYTKITKEEFNNWMKEFNVFEDDLMEMEKIDKEKSIEMRNDLMKIYEKKQDILIHHKKLESKLQLRLQVKDFIEWLKGQGVI